MKKVRRPVRCRLRLPALSPHLRSGRFNPLPHFQKPLISSSHIISPPSLFLITNKMESSSLASTPAAVHLCDALLERLRDFATYGNRSGAFCDEVCTLRKFLDLIDRVFKAKLSRMPIEEQHFASVDVLLDRCRTTLSRLIAIFAASDSTHSGAESLNTVQEPIGILEDSNVLVLRASLGFYILILQMSLQTVKL